MKSGLEGRNNEAMVTRWPKAEVVSMKSGLEGRNNIRSVSFLPSGRSCLNEVRPRRPEQCVMLRWTAGTTSSLNEVRPRRPEQLGGFREGGDERAHVSMKSGLEGRNNHAAERR